MYIECFVWSMFVSWHWNLICTVTDIDSQYVYQRVDCHHLFIVVYVYCYIKGPFSVHIVACLSYNDVSLFMYLYYVLPTLQVMWVLSIVVRETLRVRRISRQPKQRNASSFSVIALTDTWRTEWAPVSFRRPSIRYSYVRSRLSDLYVVSKPL